MPEPAPKAELMRSLGRLVRGLSALFWGLPATLLASVHTAANDSDWFRSLGIAPPIAANALLFYGLWQMAHFQRQERPWQQSLERAKLLAVGNLGLSPFLFWWNIAPREIFYLEMVALLTAGSLFFLLALNQVLKRLTAMLPDETLRLEAKLFTSVNLCLLLATFVLAAAYYGLARLTHLPRPVILVLQAIEASRRLILLFLILLPLAMIMALIWKIKEAVLASVFTQR